MGAVEGGGWEGGSGVEVQVGEVEGVDQGGWVVVGFGGEEEGEWVPVVGGGRRGRVEVGEGGGCGGRRAGGEVRVEDGGGLVGDGG